MNQTGFQKVDDKFTVGFDALVAFHSVNIYLGAACTFIAGLNLFIFLSTAKFRIMYKILTVLAIADLINTISKIMMGINRKNLYSDVLETHLIPIRNSWDCAVEPWLWMQGIGDLWPPIIQLCMGMERACSILYPVFFRERVERNSKYIISMTVLFVILSLIVGFTLAFISRNAGPVTYYCGRKAAFSKEYGTFIYATNVICYILGFCFNLVAYIKALNLKKAPQASRLNHIRKIRYYLCISLLSTILVSVPNLISIFSVWVKEVDNAIARPAVWMACANSALSPFVYFAFNRDYRSRLLQLIEIHSHTTKNITAFTATTGRIDGRIRNNQFTITPEITGR